MNLTKTAQDIAPQMRHFLSAYQSLTGSDTPIIQTVNRHVQQHGGKQLRPLLTMMTALCCGLPSDTDGDHPLFSLSAAIETLHNATLIHDDVVDESDLRRNQPTVNQLWSNQIAVLVGDYYLAQVMLTVNAVNIPEVTHLINQLVVDMTEGELLQQECCRHYDIDESIYYRIIRKKTACFLAACCEIGARLATDDHQLHEAAHQFGCHLGMAFQLRDDLMDYLPSSRTGKPQGNDLREHKTTLPLILALRQANPHTKNEILALLEKKHPDNDDILRLTDLVATEETVQMTRYELEKHLETAKESALLLPDNRYRDHLLDICRMLQEI